MVARAHLSGLVILQASVVHYKCGMEPSKLKVIRQIPQRSLISISLHEITQNLGKGDAQIKAGDWVLFLHSPGSSVKFKRVLWEFKIMGNQCHLFKL